MKHIDEPNRPKGEADQLELDRSNLSFNPDNGPEPFNPDELEDVEYISDTNVAVLIKTPGEWCLLIYTMILVLISAIVWGSYARLDEITWDIGIVIPSSRLQVVPYLEGGILEEIFIKEVSKVELLQLKQRVNDLESQNRKTELFIPKLHASYHESRARREEAIQKYRAEIMQELEKTDVHLDQLDESDTVLKDQGERTLVRSPIDGIVKKSMSPSSVAWCRRACMSLPEIVPLEDNLLIETQIQPRDIGFLRKGMSAIAKLTAHDFAVYRPS